MKTFETDAEVRNAVYAALHVWLVEQRSLFYDFTHPR
jgi:hypothetical protein